MKRRDFLKTLSAGTISLSIPSCRKTNLPSLVKGGKRPNILFLFSDDQRPDAIGAYGNRHIITPHIDRLVMNGFSFRQAYCMGSIHSAVCQPSRAMLLGGRTLYRVPMDLNGVKTFPEVLRESGYITFGTGKWHNSSASFIRGFTKGQAVFLSGMSNHLKVMVRDLISDGRFTDAHIGEVFSSELFADATIDFLKSVGNNKPFFAYVSFSAPHDPRMPPKEYADMYNPSTIPLPRNFMPQHPFFNGWMTGRDEALAPWPRTPEIIQAQLADYYGMITHMDHQIGRILTVLEESGLSENTIIIFSSDQGLAMGSHGLLGKQNLYEQSMGAPLVFSGPGIPQGKSSDALVYLFDIYPTLCNLAGVDIPVQVEGKSLVSVIRGEQKSIRHSIYLSYVDNQRAVRDHRWKLIRYPQINKTQLFDLQNDPDEMTNLAGDPRQAVRVEKLMVLLKEWQKQVGDDQPLTSLTPMSPEIDLTGRKRIPDEHQPEEIVRKYFSGQNL